MEEVLSIKLSKKSSKKIKQIAKFKKVEESKIIEDLIVTFCNMPIIVSCDLDDFCIKQMEKCDTDDTHRKSTFTTERLDAYKRMQYFVEMVYNAQVQQLKEIENTESEN